MKKIMLGIIIIVGVIIFFFGDYIAVNKEETSGGNEMVMLAPDLDLESATEEEIALLIEIGWDLSGEIPSLTIREENVDYEVQNGVVNLTDLLEKMDEGMDENE